MLKSGKPRSDPSLAQSTLLSKLTNTESEAASYEFTTLTALGGSKCRISACAFKLHAQKKKRILRSPRSRWRKGSA